MVGFDVKFNVCSRHTSNDKYVLIMNCNPPPVLLITFLTLHYFPLLADAVNLLSLTNSGSNTRMSMDEIATHINQVVDKNDFTIMFTIRSQVDPRICFCAYMSFAQ